MKKQDQLVLTVQKHSDELQDENQRFSKAIVELQKISDDKFEKDLTIGIGGAMVGVIVTTLLLNRR